MEPVQTLMAIFETVRIKLEKTENKAALDVSVSLHIIFSSILVSIIKYSGEMIYVPYYYFPLSDICKEDWIKIRLLYESPMFLYEIFDLFPQYSILDMVLKLREKYRPKIDRLDGNLLRRKLVLVDDWCQVNCYRILLWEKFRKEREIRISGINVINIGGPYYNERLIMRNIRSDALNINLDYCGSPNTIYWDIRDDVVGKLNEMGIFRVRTIKLLNVYLEDFSVIFDMGEKLGVKYIIASTGVNFSHDLWKIRKIGGFFVAKYP